jgi:hypothetical protein
MKSPTKILRYLAVMLQVPSHSSESTLTSPVPAPHRQLERRAHRPTPSAAYNASQQHRSPSRRRPSALHPLFSLVLDDDDDSGRSRRSTSAEIRMEWAM